MKPFSFPIVFSFALAMLAALAPEARAQGGCCVLNDNGNGTVDMPPVCPLPGPMLIDNGIPGGTIEIDAELNSYFNDSESPGGTLGGTIATFDAVLELSMTGTGSLNNFNRTLFMLVANSQFHYAPRVDGDPVQSFLADVGSMSGQIFGDPDFDFISVQAGTAFGLPSPGQTTLTRLGSPGTPFNVDSFFDIHYEITFTGAPGSVLEGMGGTTSSNGLFEVCPGIATGVAGPPVDVESSWGDLKRLFR